MMRGECSHTLKKSTEAEIIENTQSQRVFCGGVSKRQRKDVLEEVL